MSNKTQLQTNNTALDALITRVNAAKETAASLPEAGGGSGGGSVETCTVTLTQNSSEDKSFLGYACTQWINGEATYSCGNMLPNGTVTIENVIKKSIVTIIVLQSQILSDGIISFDIDNMLDEDYGDTFLYLRVWDLGGDECSCTVYTD